MDYDLYLDLLFLTDGFANLLLLSLASVISRRPLRPFRAVTAAAVGAAWTCFLAVFPVLPALAQVVLTAILCGCLMVILAFPVRNAREVVQMDAILLFASGCLGGSLLFLTQFCFLRDWEALFCLTAVYAAVRILWRFLEEGRRQGRKRYEVQLYYRGKEKTFRALADTGNRLTEPMSGKPVSVISYGDCAGFCETVSQVLFIPYRAVGTKAGLLPGLIFEKMEILNDGTTLTIERPIVAVSREPLSVDGDFTMLLPEELVL